MADAIGTLDLPAPLQSAGEALGDANLQKFGDFFKAVILAKLDANWKQVAPNKPIVKTLQLHDPNICGVNNSDLPALFVWRSDSEPERMTDDWHVDHSEITVVWLPDPVVQEQLVRRMPMLNGVVKAIQHALVLGRDPAWVDIGDPDATAAELGSVLTTRANLIQEPKLKSCKAAPITLHMDKETARYPGVIAKIDAKELSTWDLALRGDTPPQHQTTLTVGSSYDVVAREPATPDTP